MVYRTVCLAIILACTSMGCLTLGVIEMAKGEIPAQAEITRVRGATVRNQELFLLLDIQGRKPRAAQTFLLRVPLDEIGTYRGVPLAPGMKKGGLGLHPPPMGCFETRTDLPEDGTALPITYMSLGSYDDLAPRINSLPVGVHVLIVSYYSVSAPRGPNAAPQDGTVPSGAELTLVTRSAEEAPRQQVLRGFQEDPGKHRAWLLLTPLSVVGDIVTFPFQVIYGLMVDC